MAYNFIPVNVEQIYNCNATIALVNLYEELCKKSQMDDPIAIDSSTLSKSKTKVKIHRNISSNTELFSYLTDKYDSLHLTVGNGSRYAVDGFILEDQINNDINNYINSIDKINFKHTNNTPIIIDGLKEYLEPYSIFRSYKPTPKKRNIYVSNTELLVSNSEGCDIADIIIDDINENSHYISIKKTSEYRLFNLGIKTVIDDPIQKQYLLNHLGINSTLFEQMFFENDCKQKEIVETPEINKNIITNFLASGLGNNYILIHNTTGNYFDFKYITNQYSKKAMELLEYKIKYPIGIHKHLTIFAKTADFNLKLEIRNNKGNFIPQVLQCKVY